MSAWGLLVVPAALLSVSLLLVLTSWLERRMLSPRALILSAARARNAPPGHVEVLVAQQCDRLLDPTDRPA
jgi:hypothetical protein